MAKNYKELYELNIDEAEQIFLERNKSYGSAFELMGLLGIAAEIVGIAGKLIMLVIRHPANGAQNPPSVRNAMIDCINFAAMGMMMINEENWKGKGLGND